MKNRWKQFFSFADRERAGQLIQVYGRGEVYMEGCKQVLCCDDTCIRVRGSFLVRVEGEGLILKEMGDEVLCAQGKIRGVYFEE